MGIKWIPVVERDRREIEG
jgi:hypothetical protein